MITRFVSPGEMRTAISVCKAVKERDEDGYTTETYEAIANVKSRWVSVHGTESFTADMQGYTQPATVTIRYCADITEDCIVYKDGESTPYRIISVNNVEGRNRWLEIKVTKKSRENE